MVRRVVNGEPNLKRPTALCILYMEDASPHSDIATVEIQRDQLKLKFRYIIMFARVNVVQSAERC